MSCFDSIRNTANDCIKAFPSDALPKLAWSVGGSFVLGTIFTGHPVGGFVSAAMAGVACGIHILSTPIFRKLAPTETHVHWWQELIRTVSVIVLSGLLLNLCGLPYQINLLAAAVFNGVLVLATNGFYAYPLDRAPLFLINATVQSPNGFH